MTPAAAEPYMPSEGADALEDFAFDLAREASELSGQLHPLVRSSVGDLVRSMNCYYSNLIEGHNTHPRDIDRALSADYSSDPRKRDLQLEARAHIEVQRMIDTHAFPVPPASRAFIERTHREFCTRLPQSLLIAENPQTHEQLEVIPGALRTRSVAVGRHVPPAAEDIPAFLRRFEEAYDRNRLTKARLTIAIAAAHHRLLWIHPFLDGNGRVARLMSHAMLLDLGIGSALWSVSRGLARRSSDYKRLLMAADEPRRGDLDGRGSLSQSALVEFCAFFLESCLDQVRYMRELLDPSELQRRMELYVRDEEGAGRLPRRSFTVLREALLAGELDRQRVPALIDASERTARRLVSALVQKRLLIADSHKGPLRLGFPVDVVERWFPRLYPPLERATPSAPRNSSSIICEAIRGRALLQFTYRGYTRVVAPYCYGTSARNSEILRAIQVRGHSSSGGLGFRKLWTVSDMIDLQILDETFTADDPNYNPNDSAMKRIWCRIESPGESAGP